MVGGIREGASVKSSEGPANWNRLCGGVDRKAVAVLDQRERVGEQEVISDSCF